VIGFDGKNVDKSDLGQFVGYYVSSFYGGTGKNNQVPESWNPAVRYATGVFMFTHSVRFTVTETTALGNNIVVFAFCRVTLSGFVLSSILLTMLHCQKRVLF